MNNHIRHHALLTAVIFTILSITSTLFAAAPTGPVLVTSPPAIDGVLDETAWKKAFEITDFSVIDPETRETASLGTTFKFLYDKKNLYIGVVCEQPADTQVKRISARDQENKYVDRDMIRVIIDPTAQGLYGYIFDVYLGGSLTDGTIRPERDATYNWDGPYRAVTSQATDHWYAEYAIPWDCMQFPAKGSNDRRILGVYVQRDVAHLSERWANPDITINAPVFLSAYGKMDVTGINAQGNLTLFPYASVGYTGGFLKERTQDVGLDAFWQATDNVLVSATINPDFGDVENDDVEANFDTTETLLQEKRTFFVKGNEIFKTKGLDLINTRRIGDAPDEPLLLKETTTTKAEGYRYKPQTTDIIGAMKMTGAADKMRYGIISAFEGDSEYFTRQTDLAGNTVLLRRPEVDGRNFFGARALFENHSRRSDYIGVGYLGTYVQHSDYDAMVNSIDGQWLTLNQKLRLEGQVAMSNIAVDNNPESVQWAKDNKVNDETGLAYNAKVIYYPTPSSHVIAQVDALESEFNHNDFGYASRLDRTHYNIEYRNNRSDIEGTKWFRYTFYTSGDYNKGNLLKSDTGILAFAMLDNLQKTYLQAYFTPRAWDDAVTYQQKCFRTKQGWFVWLSWFSDESKPFHVYINPRYYTEKNGGITKYYRGRIKWSPLDVWSLETEVTFWNKQHWLVGRKSDTRVDGFNAHQYQVNIKSNFKLTARQELRFQLQWLAIDAEDKVRYQTANGGYLTRAPIDYTGATLDKTDGDRTFGYGQFVGQIRYKYEFAPLSELFIVYNRAGLSRKGGDLTWDEIWYNSWDKRDVDKFLVKIRYRF